MVRLGRSMHFLRLELRGPDEAAEAIRERLSALGAEPGDGDGRLLLLTSEAPPADVKRHVMADVPRGRIDAEHFALLGRALHVERWNPKSVGRGSTEHLDVAERHDRHDYYDRYDDRRWWSEDRSRDAPADLDPELRLAVDAVLGARGPSAVADAEDVLAFLVDLGRLAASRSADDPAMLAMAAFLLDQGARATARTDSPADLLHERALLATRAAWEAGRADRGREPESLLPTLQALAGAAERLIAWSCSPGLVMRSVAAPTCRTAFAACLRTMARAAAIRSVAPA